MKRFLCVLLVLAVAFGSLSARSLIAIDGYYDRLFLFIIIPDDYVSDDDIMNVVEENYPENLYAIYNFKDDYNSGRIFFEQIGYKRFVNASYYNMSSYSYEGNNSMITAIGGTAKKALLDIVFPNGYKRISI